MNRREFLKVSLAGATTFALSACGLSFLGGDSKSVAPKVEVKKAGAQGKNLKVVVITGSPHAKGTSACLADNFIKGAQEAGHEVFRFNAAFEKINPCTGCNICQGSRDCVFSDTFKTNLLPKLLEADVICLVTPLYYYGMSAQLKTVLDRFYSHTEKLKNKKSVLLTTAWNSSSETFVALLEHYKTLAQYMNWQDMGMVLGYGCGFRSAVEGSGYPKEAHNLGRNL